MKHFNSASEQYDAYERILLRENEKYNLTAITDPADIRRKHFADSLALLDHFEVAQGARLLDVGSGAGFPGVPLKIERPDLEVSLLDSTAKKCNFLYMLGTELELPLKIYCERAEEAAYDPAMRERFDIVVSRAVAGLPTLLELCLPFVAVGGVFVAYKGMRGQTDEEMERVLRALPLLGGEIESVVDEQTEYGHRTLVIVRKNRQCQPEYPRNYAAISKKPL